MDNLAEWARELNARLSGPNYAAVCHKAFSLQKKRKRSQTASSRRLVTRSMLVSGKQFLSPVMGGMQRLKQFRSLLEQIDVLYKKRSIGQRDFHDAFTVASLPHIVGEEDWDQHRSSFLEFMDTDEYRGEVLITTPVSMYIW